MIAVLIFVMCTSAANADDINWQGKWAFSCYFDGNDLKSVPSQGKDCGGICASTTGCTHFTWTRFNGGTCWMKQGKVSKNDAKKSNIQDIVCGFVDNSIEDSNEIVWNDNWAYSCDFYNNDLTNIFGKGENCNGFCLKTPGCTHYSWNSHNGGTCWLKQGVVSKSDAFKIDQENTMCGLLKYNDNAFPGCQFKSGRSFDPSQTDSQTYANFDYISIWIGTIDPTLGTDFNVYYQGVMIDTCKNQNKIPVFYAYIIAFEARYQKGLKDCNDDDPVNNLCTMGAQYIRDNRQHIVDRYAYQASNIAERLGSDQTCVFLIEPDFYQYYGDSRQSGGTLSGEYMRDLLNDFVSQIKVSLPNAIIAWDISAWIGEDGFRNWWNYFKDSQIDLLFTSGGESHGDSANIKPNELTWSFVSQTSGKKIIADCGYGVVGQTLDNCGVWSDENNLNNRKNDGVVALSQAYGFYAIQKPSLC